MPLCGNPRRAHLRKSCAPPMKSRVSQNPMRTRPVPNTIPPLGPGQRAPSLVVRGVDGSNLTLMPREREPIVLAFLDGWSLRDEQDDALHALRAELRPLGAVLVALTPDALWHFRPHDETQTFATAIELDAEDVRALRASYGLGRERDALGLFVIDCSNTIRFGHVAGAQDFLEPGEVLLAALSAAGRALLVPRPRSGLVSRRELVAACLVVGFAVILLEASEPALPSLPAGPPLGRLRERSNAGRDRRHARRERFRADCARASRRLAARRPPRPHRDDGPQGRLRARRVRSVHGPRGRPQGVRLLDARRGRPEREDHDPRGPRPGSRTASAAGARRRGCPRAPLLIHVEAFRIGTRTSRRAREVACRK